jgi:hypothetical protein
MIIPLIMSETEHIDVTTEPAAEAPPVYSGDRDGLRQAAADVGRERDDKAADTARRTVTDEQRQRAKATLRKRVAEHKGIREEDVDLDHPAWQGDEPPTIRTGAKSIGEWRRTLDAAEAEVITEQAQEAEVERAIAETDAQERAQAAETQRQERAAQQQQQVESARAQISHHVAALAHQLRSIDQAVAQKFPEIAQLAEFARTNPAEGRQLLATWAAQNPQKAAELAHAHSYYQQVQQQAALTAHARQQHEAATFQNYARQEDEKFSASHPELSDKAKSRALQEDAMEYLKSTGLTEDRIRQLYNTNPEFRSAEAQAMLYAAVQHWRGQKAVKNLNAHRAPPPPVQKPGVGRGFGSSHASAVEAAEQRFRSATGTRAQLAAAAAKVKAMRAGRR